MALYEQLFRVYGTQVAQLLISIPDLEYTGPRKQTCSTLDGLMRRGIVPVVNENDAVAYEAADGDGSVDKAELPITDNDAIAAVLEAELARGDVSFGAKSSMGRGGMESKVRAAR